MNNLSSRTHPNEVTPEGYPGPFRAHRSARIWSEEVAPLWDEPFARSILRNLPPLEAGTVLDVHCKHGFTSAALLQRLPPAVKVLALQHEPSLDALAKTSIAAPQRKRIQFRPGNFDDVTVMPEQGFELAVGNLVLGEAVPDWSNGLDELLRVVAMHGHLIASMVLQGTWHEVDGLFAEVLAAQGLFDELSLFEEIQAMRPTPSKLRKELENLGIAPEDSWIEFSRYELLFRSGREFLYAPVIQQGPLQLWRAILRRCDVPQVVFGRLREAMDTYYRDQILASTVVIGTLVLQKGGPAEGQSCLRDRQRRESGAELAMLNNSANSEPGAESQAAAFPDATGPATGLATGPTSERATGLATGPTSERATGLATGPTSERATDLDPPNKSPLELIGTDRFTANPSPEFWPSPTELPDASPEENPGPSSE